MMKEFTATFGPVRKDAGLSITKADTLRKQKKNPEYS